MTTLTNNGQRDKWRDISIIVMLLGQFGALIWGAATLRSAVTGLEKVVSELKVNSNVESERVRQIERAQARDQGRMDALQSIVVELQQRERR